MVFDTMEVWSCVPRVFLNVFCCLVCKNMDDTADFRVDDDCDKYFCFKGGQIFLIREISNHRRDILTLRVGGQTYLN